MFIFTGAAVCGRLPVNASSALALAAMLVVSAPATAQTVTPEHPQADGVPSAGPTDGVQDIVVTAQRRPEAAQAVSAALTVIAGSELDRRNIYNVTDLENSVPSLEIDSQFGGGQPQFRIRGVGGTDYAANNTGTVGVYVDEVAYPYGSMTQGALFDIARVEVLRGPQGTLYGRNSTGGAINVITNAPTRRFSAGLDASYGSYDETSVDGFVSGPLSKTLSARLAFSVNEGGAWQYNRDTGQKLGDKDQQSARLKLRWEPGANTTVDFSAHYGRDKSDGSGLQLLSSFQSHAYAPLGKLYPADTDPRVTGWGISPYFAKLIGVGTDAKPFRNNEGYGASIRAQSDLGWGTLTALLAHESFKRREFNDWDATASNEAGTYFFNDIKTTSGEVRLASKGNGPFSWLGGLYHANETVSGGFYSDFSEASTLKNYYSTTYDQKVQTTAVFGNVEDYLTSRLKVSVGARYEYETRALDNFVSAIIYPTYRLASAASPRRDMREWSGKAAIDWAMLRDVHGYASVSRGVKSGGFTTYNSGNPLQAEPYNPETLVAYEVGLKSDLFDRKLRLNLAGFYYDYRNQQLQGILYTATSRVGRIVNVPKSHLYGVEGEVTLAPVRGLNIVQSLAFKYGEYDEYAAPDSATLNADGTYSNITYVNHAGERLPLPKIDYKGSVSYRFPVFGWQVEPEFNYNYRGSKFSTSDASVIPAYWLANANLTVSPPHSALKVSLWAHNVFDAYIEETRNRFITARTVSVHPPRTVGVRASYRY